MHEEDIEGIWSLMMDHQLESPDLPLLCDAAKPATLAATRSEMGFLSGKGAFIAELPKPTTLATGDFAVLACAGLWGSCHCHPLSWLGHAHRFPRTRRWRNADFHSSTWTWRDTGKSRMGKAFGEGGGG